MKNIFLNNYLLAILSGILLSLGWFEWGTGLFMLVGFVPLLIIIERQAKITRGGLEVFLMAGATILVWHYASTWWIKNVSYSGMLISILASMLYMSLPVWLSFQARKAWGQKFGLIAFIVLWLAFEFCYIHGEVSFPWLILGNGFAYDIKLIQWYDTTGVLGGSFWILLINVLVFKTFFSEIKFKFKIKFSIWLVFLIILPISISLFKYHTYEEKKNPRKIIIVQPNIDPFLKFTDIPSIEQTHIQVDLAKELLDSTIDYVVAPETSINNDIWGDEFDSVPDFKLLYSLQDSFPKMKYIVGITCSREYLPGDTLTKTAQKFIDEDSYYDDFNSAIQIDSTDSIQLYHKSKLVLGAEKIPYPNILKALKPIMVPLGINPYSLGTQQNREVFGASDDSVKIAPVICYESIFGEYISDYIKLGAGLIFVITNDGWYGNTAGHRQHNALSSLRAIEMRRSIARSANTGISSFINQRGDVEKSIGWWMRDSIVGELNINTKLTFYAKHGDFIGRIAFYLGILIIILLLVTQLIFWKWEK